MRLGLAHLAMAALLLLPSGIAASAHNGHHYHHKHHPAPSSTFDSTTASDAATHILTRRADDYTCGPDRPCKNKACCGPSNVCGYGELYCGKGCQSNCDATAECGRDAATPGTLCPLNICCSEFGFCGTTEEFCSGGCQSNCNDPERPSPGESGDVRNHVIGYYESWRAEGSACGYMRPEEIPVEYLSQVNLAFVYIDPVHLGDHR